MLRDFIEGLLISCVCCVALFMGYMFFVWMPHAMLAEVACLKDGMPKYAVTVTLEIYCISADGIKVIPYRK